MMSGEALPRGRDFAKIVSGRLRKGTALPLIIMASQTENISRARRPFAVWLALGILVFYIPFSFLMIFWPSESVLDRPDFADDLVGLAEIAAVLISLAIAIWAFAVRKQWGRWFVAAPVAYLVGTVVVGTLHLY
jgi:uncharacterized membrane protein (DUF485 family)